MDRRHDTQQGPKKKSPKKTAARRNSTDRSYLTSLYDLKVQEFKGKRIENKNTMQVMPKIDVAQINGYKLLKQQITVANRQKHIQRKSP